MANDVRIINLPTASTLTASSYMVADNSGSDGTVKFTYTQLGNILASTVYVDKMCTDAELTALETALGISS